MTAAVLAAAAARRLVLRRGLGALAALFVSVPAPLTRQATASVPGDDGGIPCTASGSSDDSKARENAAEPYYALRRAYYRDRERKDNAWNYPDADLQVLGSTSRAWRAGVMIDRLKARETVVQTWQDKIDRIWQEPVARLNALVAGWLRGEP